MDGSREAQQAAKMRSGGVPQYNVQTVTHMVPASRIGLCIGKGGETVRILQERSGAKIIVTPDRDTDLSAPDRPIAITGSPEMIAMARQLIDELVYSVQTIFVFYKQENKAKRLIGSSYWWCRWLWPTTSRTSWTATTWRVLSATTTAAATALQRARRCAHVALCGR